MSRLRVLFIILFFWMWTPTSVFATFCIPTFYTGKIVVATVEDYQIKCINNNPEEIEVTFNSHASFWGWVPKEFNTQWREGLYDPNLCNNDSKSKTILLGGIMASYEFEIGKTYAMKLEQNKDFFNFPMCQGKTVEEVSSVFDLKVIQMVFNTLTTNILLGYILLPYLILSPLESIGIPREILSSIGLILHGVLLITILILVVKFIIRIIRKFRKQV